MRTLAELTAGGDMATVHEYVLGYKYDLNSRRTELKHPVQLAPSGTQNTTKYEYSVAGSLAAITDSLGYRFTYEYNARGELTKSALTNRSLSYEKYSYDGEGNQVGDTISDAGVLRRSTAISYLPGGKMELTRLSQVVPASRRAKRWSGRAP